MAFGRRPTTSTNSLAAGAASSRTSPLRTVSATASLRWQHRAAVALLAAIGAGVLKTWLVVSRRNTAADVDELIVGARALLHGQSPYVAVMAQIGRWPLYYPVHAVLLHAPLTILPMPAARVLYAALSAFAFTFSVTRDGWQRLPVVLSAAFLLAIANGQWAPLLIAALAYPAFAFLLVSKPTTGGALLLAYAPQLVRRRAFWVGMAIAAALVIAGTALDPRWPMEWLDATRHAPHVRAPALYAPWLAGPMALAALTRWRRPEARLLAIMLIMPQSFTGYELLVIVTLVPASRIETIVLALATWLAEMPGGFVSDYDSTVPYMRAHALWYLGLVYLPALIIALRRPNEAPVTSAAS